MSGSVLTPDLYWKMNYDVPESEVQEAFTTMKALGHKIITTEITWYRYAVEDVDGGQVLSPRTFVDRVKAGYYEKKTKRKRDAEVEVPPHRGRSSRPVVPRDADVQEGVKRVRGDSDKRVGKRKGTRSNGKGTRKAVRGRSSSLPEERPSRPSRKKTSVTRERRPRFSELEDNYNTRETRVGRGRRPKSDSSKSRGAKRSTRPQRKALRR